MTPEQRAAHDLAEEAINALHAAYIDEEGDTDGPSLLTDYVILTARHYEPGPDRHVLTGHGMFTPPQAPAYQTLGLLTRASHRLSYAFSKDD